MRKNHSMLLRFIASAVLAAVLLTSCAGGATTYEKQMELGRKYLTEMNYAEAIAAFTEAIKLNPDDIEAYMARAEAYAALKKYDEATADYTAVIEKTNDQPYLQATAYIGRAGVSESTAAITDAESDYAAALAQLEKDTDKQDADAVLTLKKDVLAKHAAACITLALLEKAADDYDALEALGENVTAKRDELADLMGDATGADTDVENDLTLDKADVDTTETPETPETEETPDSKETAADSKEENPASSKEEAASSKEEAAESKQEEQPAQKVAYQVPTGSSQSKASVTYQMGTNTVQTMQKNDYDDPDWPGEWAEWNTTYTLSQPVLAVEHPGQDSTLVHVPDGTVITMLEKYRGEWWEQTGELEADGTSQWALTPESSSNNLLIWGAFSSAKEYIQAIGQVWKDETVMDGTSITVKKGHTYGIAQPGDGVSESTFPAIAFTAD